MTNVIYPNKRWRHDADAWRYIGSGGGAIPAVLGACGPATAKGREGQFWFSDGEVNGYAPTLERAKLAVEAMIL